MLIAVPTGLALRLHPAAVLIAATLGEVVGSVIILLTGEQVRA